MKRFAESAPSLALFFCTLHLYLPGSRRHPSGDDALLAVVYAGVPHPVVGEGLGGGAPQEVGPVQLGVSLAHQGVGGLAEAVDVGLQVLEGLGAR